MEAREEEDKINDFGRNPIGESRDERVRKTMSKHHIIRCFYNTLYYRSTIVA